MAEAEVFVASTTPTSRGPDIFLTRPAPPRRRVTGPDGESRPQSTEALLVQLQRSQAMCDERSARIKQLEARITELETLLDAHNAQFRQKEQTESKLREECWNLELSIQDLRSQLEAAAQSATRHQNDQIRWRELVAAAAEQVEQLRSENEGLLAKQADAKTQAEQESAAHRRQLAALQRENKNLVQQMQELVAELEGLRHKARIAQRPRSKQSAAAAATILPPEDAPAGATGSELEIDFADHAALDRPRGEPLGMLRDHAGSPRESPSPRSSTRARRRGFGVRFGGKKSVRAKKAGAHGGEEGTGEVPAPEEKPHPQRRPNADSQLEDEDALSDEDENGLDSRLLPPLTEYDAMLSAGDFIANSLFAELSALNHASPLVSPPSDFSSSTAESRADSPLKPETSETRGVPKEESASTLLGLTSLLSQTGPSGATAPAEKNPGGAQEFAETNRRAVSAPVAPAGSTQATRPPSEAKGRGGRAQRATDETSEISSSRASQGKAEAASDKETSSRKKQPHRSQPSLASTTRRSKSSSSESLRHREASALPESLRIPFDLPASKPSRALVLRRTESTDRVSSLHNPPPSSDHSKSKPAALTTPATTSPSTTSLSSSSASASSSVPAYPPHKRYASGKRPKEPARAPAAHRGPRDHFIAVPNFVPVPVPMKSRILPGKNRAKKQENPPPVPPAPVDKSILAAITATMMGEFLWKYMRKLGGGPSEKRHQRFVWVHPYMRTIYWSAKRPGVVGSAEAKAKSAFIESAYAVPGYPQQNPDLPHVCLIVRTPQRELKFIAASRERHDIWMRSLTYLLSRPWVSSSAASLPLRLENQTSVSKRAEG
ncbi:uncharacterized protein VTP21DRAFT_7952 [Calcarisporiella thermophila]|uniref:uncharacterized protein n=1 Tax=Calcarisporiella thermophila TaxID=911321 RepID=UPI0037436514